MGPSISIFEVFDFLFEPDKQSHAGVVVNSLEQLQTFVEIYLGKNFHGDDLFDFVRILGLYLRHEPFKFGGAF